jgi:hypothetical protein
VIEHAFLLQFPVQPDERLVPAALPQPQLPVQSVASLTRIGTDGSGNFCGGHSNAVGLRLYFDATTRPARFSATY